MKQYVVRDLESGKYLARVELQPSCMVPSSFCPMSFSPLPVYALSFENEEEAQAVINFISDVLDWELAEGLEVVYLGISH